MGSAGTIAAGEYMKREQRTRIVGLEPVQCPTLFANGYGGHDIQGIGDKHVTWIHNVFAMDLLCCLDDRTGAVFLVRRALKASGDQPIYSAFEGQVLFELGRYEEAQRVLEHTVALDPDSAHSLYHYGLVLGRP